MLKNILQSCAIAVTLLAMFECHATAGIIRGTFAEELEIDSITRTFFNDVDPRLGVDLTDANDTTNPTGPVTLGGYLQVDLQVDQNDRHTLVLTQSGSQYDFQRVTLDISVIATPGEYISDFQLVGANSIIDNLSSSLYLSSPLFESIVLNGTSIHFEWAVTDPSDKFLFNSDGTATYEITLSTVSTVPEPGTLTTLGLATIAGCMCPLRRRPAQRA